MKMLNISIEDIVTCQSLIDTGSTHCLKSIENFKKLNNKEFQPLSIMKVAGSSLKDNIIGSIDLTIKLVTDGPSPFIYKKTFLIAHHKNDYDMILHVGADFPRLTLFKKKMHVVAVFHCVQ
jgi:hypothetical protein